MLVLIVLVGLFVLWATNRKPSPNGRNASHGYRRYRDVPGGLGGGLGHGTALVLLDPSTGKPNGKTELIYYGVRRPILHARTQERLSMAVVGSQKPIVTWITETHPDLVKIPIGPPLEYDGWTVKFDGSPHIFFLYHSRLYRVGTREDLTLAGLAGREIAIFPFEAAALPVDPQVVDGGWLLRLASAYEAGWKKLKGGWYERSGIKQGLDVVVFWSTVTAQTGQWNEIDGHLGSLDG